MSDHSQHHAHTDHAHHAHGHDAHGHGEHGGVVHAPSADAAAAYRVAYDLAQPDAGREVVLVQLEARETDWQFTPGRTTRAWTFNGQVPGPVIEATVGDVLEVRLTNQLAEPTTLHWHGLRLSAAMDGTDMVQRPIMPGEAFTYRFKLIDAGTFWYHTHSNEPVQLERGLYGALIVRGDDEPAFDRERVLVLSDVMLDANGEVAAPADHPVPAGGREGDLRLVNGTSEPELVIGSGQVERWRLINAATARYVRLSIGGRPFRMLGTGGGLLEAPVVRRDVLLTPGDRVDIAVGPFDPGERLTLTSEPYNRGVGDGRAERFATIEVGPPAPSTSSIPERLRDVPALVDGPVDASREIVFGERLEADGEVTFLINGERHLRADPVTVGKLQVWDIINASTVDHPFHLHGFFFQVLEWNGAAPPMRSWEDTVNVPAGGRVRIAWVPDDRPGEWMYHCHIVEHHAAGMMAHLAVVRRDEADHALEGRSS
jgi:FtsP/CotA-like multicopper oxidase with cupredoxin domain